MKLVTKIINRAGGVVAYIKDNWNASVEEPDIDQAEGLKIELCNKTTIFGIYRSPSFSQPTLFIDSLSKLLSQVNNNFPVFVLGDININILDLQDQNSSEYLCSLAELGFIPAITKPTRMLTCLDHIFVKAKCSKIIGCPR